MSLAAEIKRRMFAAMKAGRTVEKEILRVATGEITMTAARESKDLNDEEIQSILRKLLKSIRESLESASAEAKPSLLEEAATIESLLPKPLSVEEIVALLTDHAAEIRALPGAGPAMGAAMKVLKSQGALVEAKTVAQAIEHLRT